VLTEKRVLLGVTGGIAAYKSALLLRELRRVGAQVRVVMTRAAQGFVTPLTFQALSGKPVHLDLLDARQEAAMGHIELARWADLVLVAPASADFMARLAQGMADDLLSTLCLATRAPIALAPAMNTQMWLHPATRQNRAQLAARGVAIWGPAEGELACGEEGPGRMLEPAQLLERLADHFSPGPLSGVRVVMTAGGTREAIDPVRFIGNRSSGRMAYALARALQQLGAEVCLVSGPVALEAPTGVERVAVESAAQMRQAVMQRMEGCDIFAGVAAVADYRPAEVAEQKIKKDPQRITLTLVKNPDILAEVAALPDGPFTLGFAAETERLAAHAEAKLRRKGLDMIAANLVGGEEGGFEAERNALLLLWRGGREELPMMDKSALAERLAQRIQERFHASTRG